MNDFANVAFGYNALSSEDKARIADLIFRLMPKDDEPITAHEIEASHQRASGTCLYTVIKGFYILEIGPLFQLPSSIYDTLVINCIQPVKLLSIKIREWCHTSHGTASLRHVFRFAAGGFSAFLKTSTG